MTNEEIERNIHFIIEHQAHFAANVQFLTEQQAKFAASIQKIEEVQARFSSGLQEVKDVIFTVVGVVGKLAEAQKQTHERLDRLGQETDKRIRELAEAQKRTDGRLNAFLGVLERRFSGDGRLRGKRRKRLG